MGTHGGVFCARKTAFPHAGLLCVIGLDVGRGGGHIGSFVLMHTWLSAEVMEMHKQCSLCRRWQLSST